MSGKMSLRILRNIKKEKEDDEPQPSTSKMAQKKVKGPKKASN